MPPLRRVTDRALAVTVGLVAAIASSVHGRAESAVASDDGLPTLHCLHMFDVPTSPRALCELVNDTGNEFLFDGEDSMTPRYAVEQRSGAGWVPAGGGRESKRSRKRPLAAGATIEFSATLPHVIEPMRIGVAVYRSAGGSPISAVGNAFRMPERLGEERDGDVPVLLCHEVLPPTLVHRVKPEYPDSARQAGIQGTVVLGVIVDRDGRIQNVRVVRSIPVLDPAACSAVKQWTYKPARDRLDHPVAVYVPISVKFELPSEGRN